MNSIISLTWRPPLAHNFNQKIEWILCNCYVGVSVMLAQLGVQPDFAAAVASSAAVPS
ncbi:hypothetical protein [Streptomyces sp. uw30]|uniref:hypothetical protein n=1 Tax=Streptomyces sp. uw30 TaxID=1828179 RepID=UPI0016514489|nr:hypothetical protein [Streptomyces sp. uw30]